jgi:hypothetical protein
MQKFLLTLIGALILWWIALPARALNAGLSPGGNFNLSHWYLQLPTSGGVLTGTNGSVDSASTTQLVAGFTNAYFYTGPDGAMTFWVPDNGATTSGSSHPRSELREELIPGNANTNWMLTGTHLLTATCVVSNVPSDTGKVCIGQMHEPGTKPDGSASVGNEHMIMFDLINQKIYANISPDGNSGGSFSQTFITGSNVALGKPINYSMSIVDGVLQIIINNVTNAWDLFSGTNYSAQTFQNWDSVSGNTLYFKAGNYNQTLNTCGCPTDGARVAFFNLSIYHAPHITNEPVSIAANTGSNATFTVAASSNGSLSYQWWLNATNLLIGATNSTLMLTHITGANAGNYAVVVSDNTSSFQSVTSSAAMLFVIYSQTNFLFSTPSTTNWICPTGITSIQVECWGGGGAGGGAFRTGSTSIQYGGGGAGGAYARKNSYAVIPGNTYYLAVGAGGIAATGTLTNNVKVSGGDSWFSSNNVPPTSAGGCLAKGGEGGECAVGNTTTTAYGLGGLGTTNGSLGDIVFSGGNGGATGSSTGYGGSGGGSGGYVSNGNSGGTNGVVAVAVAGGGPGGAPNASGGNSGSGQTPTSGPGGGGGGARAATQQAGGNGAAGQVLLTYVISPAVPPVIIDLKLSADQSSYVLRGTGVVNQTYILLRTTNLNFPEVWTPVVTNSANGNGFFSFTDAPSAYSSQRFYRVSTP